MSMVYIADELIFRIKLLGKDKSKFVREAVEEKLKKEEVEG